jgi:hypothetical protein
MLGRLDAHRLHSRAGICDGHFRNGEGRMGAERAEQGVIGLTLTSCNQTWRVPHSLKCHLCHAFGLLRYCAGGSPAFSLLPSRGVIHMSSFPSSSHRSFASYLLYFSCRYSVLASSHKMRLACCKFHRQSGPSAPSLCTDSTRRSFRAVQAIRECRATRRSV